jgi:hypothetical protein
VEELKETPTARDLFAAPQPGGPALQEKAGAAGLGKPPKQEK